MKMTAKCAYNVSIIIAAQRTKNKQTKKPAFVGFSTLQRALTEETYCSEDDKLLVCAY